MCSSVDAVLKCWENTQKSIQKKKIMNNLFAIVGIIYNP